MNSNEKIINDILDLINYKNIFIQRLIDIIDLHLKQNLTYHFNLNDFLKKNQNFNENQSQTLLDFQDKILNDNDFQKIYLELIMNYYRQVIPFINLDSLEYDFYKARGYKPLYDMSGFEYTDKLDEFYNLLGLGLIIINNNNQFISFENLKLFLVEEPLLSYINKIIISFTLEFNYHDLNVTDFQEIFELKAIENPHKEILIKNYYQLYVNEVNMKYDLLFTSHWHQLNIDKISKILEQDNQNVIECHFEDLLI